MPAEPWSVHCFRSHLAFGYIKKWIPVLMSMFLNHNHSVAIFCNNNHFIFGFSCAEWHPDLAIIGKYQLKVILAIIKMNWMPALTHTHTQAQAQADSHIVHYYDIDQTIINKCHLAVWEAAFWIVVRVHPLSFLYLVQSQHFRNNNFLTILRHSLQHDA